MGKSASEQPKYLMCARALALLGGMAVGASACGGRLAPSNYDGGIMGAAPNGGAGGYDGAVLGLSVTDSGGQGGAGGGSGHDGGPMGLFVNPDADTEHPPVHDGGPVGVVINPDASSGMDTGGVPYDGGVHGVIINPDA
jgi:hypothetical protein